MRIAAGLQSGCVWSGVVPRMKNVACGPALHPPAGARRSFAVSLRAFFYFALVALLGLAFSPDPVLAASYVLSSSTWIDLGPTPMALSVTGGSMQYTEQPTQPPLGTVGMTLEPIIGAVPIPGLTEVWGIAAGGSPTAVTGAISTALTVPVTVPPGFRPHTGAQTLNVFGTPGAGYAVAVISNDPRQLVENVSSSALVPAGSSVYCWLSVLPSNPNVAPPSGGQWIASGGGYAIFSPALDQQYLACTNGGAVVKIVGGG